MSSFLPTFFYSQLFVTPPVPTQSFEGRTVIVTGANTGLGHAAAKSFVKLQAKTVILAVRNLAKGNAAKEEIVTTTSCDPRTVQVWLLDMSSYASVKDFATRVNNDLPRVDAVVENAGISAVEFVLEEDNQSTITVNLVSTFLLALLLLPALRRSAQEHGIRPTLSIVASDTHLYAQFVERHSNSGGIFEALNDKTNANMKDRYPTSKLLQVLCVRALASQMGSTSAVTINCLNPGLCRSNMTAKIDSYVGKILVGLLARQTDVGARSLVAGAAAGPESHGLYMHDCQIATPGKLVVGDEGPALQKAVWQELSAKLERISPGITANISS